LTTDERLISDQALDQKHILDSITLHADHFPGTVKFVKIFSHYSLTPVSV